MKIVKARPRSPVLRFAIPAVSFAVGGIVTWAAIQAVKSPGDPDAIWRQAQTDFMEGRYQEAADGLARVNGLRPPKGIDWVLKAQLAMAANRNDEALDALARISDGDQMAAQARLLSGQLELRRGRVAIAEKYLLQTVKLDPDMVQAHRELIYVYGMVLRRRELGEQFRELSRLAPLTFDNVFHWCLTRNVVWDAREETDILKHWLEEDPGDKWTRLALASNLRQLGRREESEKTLQPLGDDPDALVVKVHVTLDRGDDEGAEALLKTGPADHPELAALRGRIALAHREGETALQAFRKSYEVDPDQRDAVFGLGQALAMVGDARAAAPFVTLAKGYDALGTLMQRAATPEGRVDPALYRALGSACEAIQHFPEARAWYTLALNANPLDSEAQKSLYRLKDAGKPSTTTTPIAPDRSTR